jgi:hypothetical protein
MTTKNFSSEGEAPTVDELAEGLEAVSKVGLIPRRIAETAESDPALARLLDLGLLGPPDASKLVRAGQLGEVLGTVLERLGEGPVARAADPLLSISREYRGQIYEQRFNTAANEWNPDYKDNRYFGRQRKEIIRDVAAELARYQEEQLVAGRAGQPIPVTRRARRAPWYATVGVLVLAALGLSLYFVLRPSPHAATGSSYATEIEHRYDGMDPTGKDAPGTTCADPAHPSQPVSQVQPPVVDPSGKVVGYVELRTSSICQVLWARVYWRGGAYTLPPGWTLVIQMHRQVDPKVVQFVSHDASNYVYGNMLATARGCAYAEVFFAKGTMHTQPAITPCMKSY